MIQLQLMSCALLKFSSLEFVRRSKYNSEGEPKLIVGVLPRQGVSKFKFRSEVKWWSTKDDICISEYDTLKSPFILP